jgi:GNAT superfamily N-acetyltransferase
LFDWTTCFLILFTLSLPQGWTTDILPNSYQVLPIHKVPNNSVFVDQCIRLINDEWPRTRTARLFSLESSKDKLPTCLVLIKNEAEVLAHAKLSAVPSDLSSVFLESVVVHSNERGKGYGKLIMKETENYCREVLRIQTIYLSTVGDQVQAFYSKLGYTICQPINQFGRGGLKNSSTKKIYMRKDV